MIWDKIVAKVTGRQQKLSQGKSYFNPGKCGKIYMPMFHKPWPFLPFICQEVYIQIPGFILKLCHQCTLQLNKNTDTIFLQ